MKSYLNVLMEENYINLLNVFFISLCNLILTICFFVDYLIQIFFIQSLSFRKDLKIEYLHILSYRNSLY